MIGKIIHPYVYSYQREAPVARSNSKARQSLCKQDEHR